MKIQTKGYLLIGIPLTLQLCITAVLFAENIAANKKIAEESFARRVVGTANLVHQLVDNSFVSIATLRFSDVQEKVAAIKRSVKTGDRLIGELKDMAPQAGKSRKLIDDYVVAVENLQRLLKDQLGANTGSEVKGRYAGFFSEADFNFEVFITLGRVARTADALQKQYAAQAKDDTTRGVKQQHLQFLLLSAMLVDVLLAVALAVYYGRSTVSRLNLLMSKVDKFSKGEIDFQEVPGNDEITDLNERFRIMAIERNNAEHERSALLQTVSHDIRGPVGTVNLAVAGLLRAHKKLDEKEIDRRLSILSQECTRLVDLCSTFLDLESINEKNKILKIEENNARALLEKASNAVSELLSSKEQNIEIVCDEALSVTCDAERAVQILVNILSNASKFSPENSSLQLSARPYSEGTIFSVKDSGPGISEEESSVLFERFSQLKNSRGMGGSGLGLWICKQLTDWHGGRIYCAPAPEGGTVFSVEFPDKKDVASD